MYDLDQLMQENLNPVTESERIDAILNRAVHLEMHLAPHFSRTIFTALPVRGRFMVMPFVKHFLSQRETNAKQLLVKEELKEAIASMNFREIKSAIEMATIKINEASRKSTLKKNLAGLLHTGFEIQSALAAGMELGLDPQGSIPPNSLPLLEAAFYS